MTQKIKDKLEQAAETHLTDRHGHTLDAARKEGFMEGAQTILDNPGEWGLQEITDYYCAEKDRVGYVCEEGPCDRCQKVIQHDAQTTLNNPSEFGLMSISNDKEWGTTVNGVMDENRKLREALDKTQKIQEVIDGCTPLDMIWRINNIILEALKRQP